MTAERKKKTAEQGFHYKDSTVNVFETGEEN